MCEHKSLINDAFVQLSYAYERKALSLHFGDFLSWQYLSLHARLSDLSPRVLKCFQYYIFKLRCVKIWITNCLIAVYTCVSLVSDHDESMTSAQLVSITVTSVFGCSRWHHIWSYVCTVAMSILPSCLPTTASFRNVYTDQYLKFLDSPPPRICSNKQPKGKYFVSEMHVRTALH